MNIDRRHLVLPALAVGLLGVVPVLATSEDEDAVAKSVEAFRLAQFAADAKAFDELCAAELSCSFRGLVDLTRQRNKRKIEVFVAGIPGPANSCGRHRRDRAVPLGGRKPVRRRWQEKQYQSPYPNELAKTGCGLEASV